MDCPICGSDNIEILNSKQKTTKKKFTEKYLLKCEDCGHVYRNIISLKKPRPYRLIISEQDKSHKTTIDLSPLKTSRKAGYSPHKLRATTATSLIGRGNSIFDVQALLDHEQVTTTQLYAAHKKNVKQKLVRGMEWEVERNEGNNEKE